VNPNQMGGICVGVALAALLLYVAASESGGSAKTPAYEGDTGSFFSGLDTMLCKADQGDQCSGYEWKVPSEYQTGYVVSRHRYPQLSGTNMTAVIHHGWDAMMRPAPADTAWIERPPAEVEF
jgi:hypothetical protein